MPLIAFAQSPAPSPYVGVDEKLGSYVPLDLTFRDENNKTVTLKELMNNRPTILNLVYYRCPGICSPLMSGLADALGKLKMDPSRDYTVVTISFDPNEKSQTGSDKKKNYLHTFKLNFPENTWRFTTGTQENITKITDSVGYRYIEEGGQYNHPAVIMILSPDGKISRYLYGLSFLPLDIELALIEASQGKVTPTVGKIISFCFVYNPSSKKYIFNVTRISGAFILLIVMGFLFYLRTRKKIRGKADAGK